MSTGISSIASPLTEKSRTSGGDQTQPSGTVLAALSDQRIMTTACMEIIHAQQDGTGKGHQA